MKVYWHVSAFSTVEKMENINIKFEIAGNMMFVLLAFLCIISDSSI
jgi:hypothetical protein